MEFMITLLIEFPCKASMTYKVLFSSYFVYSFLVMMNFFLKAVRLVNVKIKTGHVILSRYMGTITGISDLDPVRWSNSHWRSVKVC